MTDFTIKSPAPKSTAKAGAKRAKAAVEKAVETVAEKAHIAADFVGERAHVAADFVGEKAEIGKAWTTEKAQVAHRQAEEHPVALAVGTFVAGLVFGFLLARNLDR
jgi:phage-related tail protein